MKLSEGERAGGNMCWYSGLTHDAPELTRPSARKGNVYL